MIAKVCDRESRRDTWFENRLVEEKVSNSYTNQLDFRPNFDQNYPNFFFLMLMDPFIFKILHQNKGSLIYQEADFANHVCSTSP